MPNGTYDSMATGQYVCPLRRSSSNSGALFGERGIMHNNNTALRSNASFSAKKSAGYRCINSWSLASDESAMRSLTYNYILYIKYY